MVNYIVSLVLFLFAGTYLYATFMLPSLKNTDPMGPRAFPVLLGIALASGAILLLIETIRAKREVHQKEKEPRGETQEHLRIIGSVMVWTVVFLLILEPLGYIVSTTLYIFPLMVYFNPKNWWINGATSVLFPIGVYMLFVKLLGIILPKGVIPW